MGNMSFFMNLWGVHGDESQSKREPSLCWAPVEEYGCPVGLHMSEHYVWSDVLLDIGAHPMIHRSSGLGARETWVWILLYHQQVISLKTA